MKNFGRCDLSIYRLVTHVIITFSIGFTSDMMLSHLFNTLTLRNQIVVIFINPIYVQEGGLFGSDHQIIDHNTKTALSSTSKLGDLLLLSIRHILAEF